MNDETHDSGPGDEPVDSVLRPFTPPEQPPLPPIEPSRLVAEPPAAAEEPPSDPPVPPPPPVDALTDDPWAPEADADESDDDVADDSDESDDDVADEFDDGDADESDDDVADVSDDDVADVSDDDVADESDDNDVVGGDAAAAGPTAPAATVTLPRKPFLIGLGVLVAAVALFAVLWQTSGGDDSDTVVAAPDADGPAAVGDDADSAVPDDSESTAPDDSDSAAPGDDAAAADSVADGLADDLAEARAEIVSLEASVESLEGRPPPALDGTKLRRIIVGADAKFVSARPESVAVAGAFGGVSLIDPATNRVVANGNVANVATRIMRTATSVWLTNYSDNQLLRVDPVTNTVAATFPFQGPDGIDKDGDSIVVASFDGEFVARVDPGTGEILQQVDVGGNPTEVLSHPDHGLWVAVFDTGELVRIHRGTFEIITRLSVGQGPVGISAGPLSLWVTNHDEGTIAKVDPEAGEVLFATSVGNGPTESTVLNGSVWVTVTDDGALVEVGADDGVIRTVTPLGGGSAGGGPTGISETGGDLWIAMQGEQSVVRVDLG